MKKILGLDLGISSIGWAIIEIPSYEQDQEINILGMGSNIISSDPHLIKEFQKGSGEDGSRLRRRFRNHRHFISAQTRRNTSLRSFLIEHDMLPKNVIHDRMSLWALRASSVSEKLSLKDLGRVLMHLSHKRGHTYHKDFHVNITTKGNKQSTHSTIVSQEKTELEHFKDLTIGQYYYSKLLSNANYRIKDQALPRRIHLQEFDAILDCQSKFYPNILTPQIITHLRDRIIFHQESTRWFNKRTIKRCPFESKRIIQRPFNHDQSINNANIRNKPYAVTWHSGPQVCHRSNPLFQYYRLWVDLSNVFLYHQKPESSRNLTFEEKSLLIDYLNHNEFLDLAKIPSLLSLDKSYKVKKSNSSCLSFGDTFNRKRIKGNQTLVSLNAILGKNYKHLLSFSIQFISSNKELGEDSVLMVEDKVIQEPLYILWRDIFATKDKQILAKTLKSKYGISEADIIDKLCALDYYKSSSFSNISLKAIKKFLPLLMKGYTYEEVLILLGYLSSPRDNDSELTAPQTYNSSQKLLPLSHIKRGYLKSPIVVKVINKMVSLVKRLLTEYGNFDEIHIEMARELKMSSSQRKSFFIQNLNNENKNEELSKKIEKEVGITPTKKKINKLRLWNETEGRCIYCTKDIPMEGYILGSEGQIEHIIPRSLQFNTSLNNQICSCNQCNAHKGNFTGYDFMASKGPEELKKYIQRVEELCSKGQISFIKRDNLLTQAFELDDNFITSQLKASQFISTKAIEVLSSICPNIIPTKGIITSFLRHIWNYEDLLLQLNNSSNFKRNTEILESSEMDDENETILKSTNPQEIKKVPNNGWSKRLDHRHHSIDALVIALTTSSIIKKLDTMSQNDILTERDLAPLHPNTLIRSSLERILISTPRPDQNAVKSCIEQIIVSHQSGSDRVRHSFRSSTGKRIKTLTPKGSLHRETIYGEIKRLSEGKIVKHKVVRVPLDTINTDKLADRIVDPILREIIKLRLNAGKENTQILSSPLYSDKAFTQQIRRVRCFSYHKNLTPLRFDKTGKAICFVRTDNNHHVSLYKLPNGKIVEKVVSFFYYAKLRRLGLNGVIMDPKAQWERIKEVDSEVFNLDMSVKECLPPLESTHIMTLMKNQMYILGLSKEKIQSALEKEDYTFLSGHIYRLVAISASNYRFVLHNLSEFNLKDFNKTEGRCILYSSISKFLAVNPTRIFVDNIGRINLI